MSIVFISNFIRRASEERIQRLMAAAPGSAHRHIDSGHLIAPKDESGRAWWCFDCQRWLVRLEVRS